MAKIKTSDIYQDTGELKKLISEIKAVQKAVVDLKKSELAAAKKVAAGIKSTTGATGRQRQQLTTAAKQIFEINKRYDKYTNTLTANGKKLAELAELQRRANLQNKLELKLKNSLTGSYDRLSAQYSINKLKLNALSDAQRFGTKSGRELERQTKAIYLEMDRLQKRSGKAQLSVGKYASAFRGAFGVLKAAVFAGGIVQGVRVIGDAFRDSVGVFADFQRQISTLGALSGAGPDALANLEVLARDLGKSTRFTASEVAGLEIEFAKLGFEPAEIMNATASTLDLATIAGSDLAETAAVVGSNIRAFGLDSSEAQRVVDVMAKSFSSSALDMQKFKVAMAQVAPVAKNAGLTIEETTALMGSLADAGVDASTIGSGLRNVFLDMAEQGLTLEEALTKIDTASNKNVEALDLFGKRGATVGSVLADFQSRTEKLNGKLEDAAGFAERAADKIEGDFKGSLETLNSAYQDLQITIVGFVQGALTSFIVGLTNVVRSVSTFIETLKLLPEFIRENKVTLAALGVALVAFNANLIIANATILISNARLKIFAAGQKAAAVATGFFTVATKGLNAAMRSNPVGLVITAIALLVAGLDQAYKRSETFRRALSGLKAVGVEIFTVFKEAFQAIKDGNFLKGGKLIAEGLTQGKRLKDAFNKGYEDGKDPIKNRSDLKRGIAEVGEAITDTNDKIVDSNKAVVKSLDSMEKELSKLIKRRSEVDVNSDEFKRLGKEIEALNKEISKYSGSTKEAAKETAKLKNAVDSINPNSIEALEKKVSDLKKKLSTADIGDSQGILTELLDAEGALKAAEDYQKAVRKLLTGDRTEAVDVLPSGLVAKTISELDRVKADIENAEPEKKKDIFSLLGFDLSEEGTAAAFDALKFAKSQVLDFVNKNVELSEKLVDRRDTEVEQAQRAVEIQIANREAGFASSVDVAQRELELAKKNQAEALREAEKAKKAQLAIEAIQQGSSLVTAAAKTFASVPFPLSAALVGLMFGSFAAAKIKSFQLAKQTFGHGDILDIGGGTHASGNDTPLGVSVGGKPAFVEKDEKVGIFSKKSVRKYGNKINDVFHALNKGVFEEQYQALNSAGAVSDTVVNIQAGTSSVDTSRMENELGQIRKQGETKNVYDQNGKLVSSTYKNVTTNYV